MVQDARPQLDIQNLRNENEMKWNGIDMVSRGKTKDAKKRTKGL